MRPRPAVSLVVCSAALALAGCGSGNSPGTGTGKAGSGTQSAGGQTTGAPGAQTTARQPGTGGPTQPGGGTLGPEGIPIERGPSLAPATTTTQGTPVDGVRCPQNEQLAYHIHAHLQVYVDGQPRQLPGGIGIIEPVAEPTRLGNLYAGTRCYYWLHTHAADGIIHIESPTTTIFTLGEFFDEWRQALSSDQVASAHGPVTALVNGKRWTKSPREIRLVPHAVIQLEVGGPLVPFHNLSFAGAGL